MPTFHQLLKKAQIKGGSNRAYLCTFQEYPKEAVRLPWDGGFSWKKDDNGQLLWPTSLPGLGGAFFWVAEIKTICMMR